jgi:hypothetical protein
LVSVFSTDDALSLRRAFELVKWVILFCFVSQPSPADELNLEYKVKAAYLYNFTKFITWPEKASPTFNICIIGHDPFGSLLSPLESKTVQEKPIRLFKFDTPKQAKDCDIVYFDNPEQRADLALPGVLLVGSLKKSLTVSSEPFFAESGGMIGFALDDGKVKLHLNLKALKQSGFNVSAKLIEVAILVEGAEHE